ncbi:transcriptional regulator, TetR family protein [Streptomyces bingchenggensis BCW-1]|uniref:Transcriptional regulator, TetR family protein n=2 Tax=Streptomyces TaxID=1883 RepID=D7CHH4_STRBB|nr:transcriptional regulator, TetR family protein [Streptomyces bingchenggensis BCW-1]
MVTAMAKGRPREFDIDDALSAAVAVFWAKGYEGTTMADLSAATGLKAGSIYAAFGSKADLFKRVLDHYAGTVFSYGPKALEAGTVREVVSRWLRSATSAMTGEATPAGCLLVHGALVTGDAASEVKADVCTRRQAGEVMLTERFERARLSGDLPAGVDPKDAARYVLALTEGMAVQAAYGADRAALERLVDLALDRLPWERTEPGAGPGAGPAGLPAQPPPG